MSMVEPVLPLRMAQVFPDDVEEKNHLYSGCTSVPLLIGNDQWEFSLTSRIMSDQWHCRIYADWGNAEVMLFLDQPLPINLGIAGLESARVQKLPPELVAAVGETVLEPALDMLERASGMQISISSMLMDAVDSDDAEEFIPFTLRHADGRLLRGAIAFAGDSEAAWDVFLNLIKRVEEPLPAWVRDVPIPLNVEVGEVKLTLHEMVSVEPQDIVLLDTCLLKEECVLLRADNSNLVFKTTVDGTTLTVQERIMTMTPEETQPDMPTEDAAPSTPPTAADIKGIQLPMRLELETISITVEELSQLNPGYIVETTKPVDAPVSLKVNGRSIGTGELVDVAGKVGVRILSLGKKATEANE